MKNFKEFMEEMDSDQSSVETRATVAKKAREASKDRVGSVSQSSSSITFNRSKGQLPRFGRRKKEEEN